MNVELDELDRHMAEAVGWRDVHRGPSGKLIGRNPAGGGQYFDDIPPFSSSFEMAWYVVRWMWQTRRLSITLVGYKDHCRVAFSESPDSPRVVSAGTGLLPAEAICRAALAAIAELGRNS